jgi:hypothetical protein
MTSTLRGRGAAFVMALRAHENALEVAPENPSYLYDLGLCHKYAGRFAEGAEANRRSLERPTRLIPSYTRQRTRHKR